MALETVYGEEFQREAPSAAFCFFVERLSEAAPQVQAFLEHRDAGEDKLWTEAVQFLPACSPGMLMAEGSDLKQVLRWRFEIETSGPIVGVAFRVLKPHWRVAG